MTRVRFYVRVALLLALSMFLASRVDASDSVAVENQKPGTQDWMIAEANLATRDANKNIAIEGYASRTSVNIGEQIDLFVHSTGDYTLRLFRIGWYNGTGGREVTVPTTRGPAVQIVPTPSSTGLVECNWLSPVALSIPTDWTSGVYLAKLTATSSGKQRYIIFVVRDDARQSHYLFQTSVTTYQAYNQWGGRSLYTAVPATQVSFDRPYEYAWSAGGASNGAGDFFRAEINMVRWLEKNGSDVTYSTNIDTHQDADVLLRHKAFLSVGHDEYWSWPMRANIERARDFGVSLGFFSSNSAYWQIRLSDSTTQQSNRIIVAYKAAALTQDPFALDSDTTNDRLITTRWRDAPVNRPEEMLLGVQYELPDVIDSSPQVGDIRVTQPNHWLYAGTGLAYGNTLPGLLVDEVDRMHSSAPTGTIRLAESKFPASAPAAAQVEAHMTVYTAPSGALVFAVGTMGWAKGLDGYRVPNDVTPVSAAAQIITANFLQRSLSSPEPSARLQPTAVTASGSNAAAASDANTSTSWVASLIPTPTNNNAWLQLDFGSRVQIDRVKWHSDASAPYPGWAPSDYSILVSDDGLYWRLAVDRQTGATGVADGNEPVGMLGRYVRFVSTKVRDGSGWALSFAELWAEGGAIASSAPVPGAITASASATGFPVDRAADESVSTFWLSALNPSPSNDDAIVQLDFGRPMQIDRIRWLGVVSQSPKVHTPADYTVVVSNDGFDWKTVVTRVGGVGVVNGNEPLNTEARYVGLVATKVHDGTGWGLGIREFWAEGSARLLVPSVTSSSSASSEYSESKATDGFATSMWVASLSPGQANNNAWIQFDFGVRKQVRRVRWQGSKGAPYPSASPSVYAVSFSDDGNGWSSAYDSAANNYGVVTGDIPVDGIGRFMRFQTTKVHDGTGYSLGLFELWAEGRNAVWASADAAIDHPSRLAIDGKGDTQWVDSQQRDVTTITFDLGTSKWFDRLRWRSGNGEVPGAAAAADYQIWISDDAASWELVVQRFNGLYSIGGPSCSTSLPNPPTSAVVYGCESVPRKARYIRFGSTKVNDGSGYVLSMVDFWVERF